MDETELTVLYAQTRALRTKLAYLAARPDWALMASSDLLAHKEPDSKIYRYRRTMRRVLARMGCGTPLLTQYPWQAGLKHAPALTGQARVLLIWAVGMPRDALRLACQGVQAHWLAASDMDRDAQNDSAAAGFVSWVPVLVTDVADFAWFSRLGWLVGCPTVAAVFESG
ncbi:hypothetical protein [Castellaniella sp.]|uniref:hypothetical protein n=1 Tax=Castellaniella sp. TaxID=1955812 RepID=UPI002B0013E5|nr:hypothetical protein [Castellaniella sp.]